MMMNINDLIEAIGIGGANCPCGKDHTKESADDKVRQERFEEITREINAELLDELNGFMARSQIASKGFMDIMDTCETLLGLDLTRKAILLLVQGAALIMEANVRVEEEEKAAKEGSAQDQADAVEAEQIWSDLP